MKSQYFTEEHELFRQSVRQFFDKEVVPNADKWEQERRIPKEIFQKMGEQGYLGINFSEEFGGINADFWYSVVFLEELGRTNLAGFTTAVSVHQYMAINHIAEVGSYELKQQYLAPAIRGEKVAALGITEPGTGSDVANITTKAERDGDHYVINGSKTFISNGTYGDFITLACKTAPQMGMGGISLIVVDLDAPGVTRTKLNKMGWHSSDTAEISFDNVRVPLSNIIGQENMGFYYLMGSLQLERLVAAIMAVPGAQGIVDHTLQYLHERQAFNRPLAKFQVIRHTIAELSTEIEMARQMVYNSCWLHSEGEVIVKEASMAKLYASELVNRTVDRCLQFFGGYGYMEDYPICRMYRDARVGTIAGGTSEIMKEIISKVVIDGVKFGAVYQGNNKKSTAK
ncbi:acyl-CoA dehydrogenase family protein [Eisenibacter elegans]|uniref:acyl-CoA dehydrogenase family protein n=1 Tax=Eisenibacter elegans TaxID=997 RepID=UPI0004197A4C|nr:acyl-CoA dehydrogenase family protein [Eisenibacter elegans]